MLHNPKDQGASEDKNNIFYGIDCSYCEADYFGESKRSLKLESNEHKRFVKNFDCKKNKKKSFIFPFVQKVGPESSVKIFINFNNFGRQFFL